MIPAVKYFVTLTKKKAAKNQDSSFMLEICFWCDLK
jgi:hypothetical protein